MGRLYKLLLLVIFFNTAAYSQNYKEEFDGYISGNEIGSKKSILKLVDEQTSRYFIIISYFVNSNNIMYLKTNDVEYLKSNDSVLKKFKEKKGKFKAKFFKHEQNYILNDKESVLLEGYLYRYIAQYYYILSRINPKIIAKKNLDTNFEYVEDRFLDWYKASNKSKNDDSFLHGIRLHMGAQWAMCTLYLSKVSIKKENLNIYENFLERFDKNLELNLKKTVFNNKTVYFWNSTWDVDFTNSLKERRSKYNEQDTVQDTAHGNHVVEYIMTAFELSYGKWNREDIGYLINTLKYVIYNEDNNQFYDLVNGTNSKTKEIKDTGKKQADGWMKLIKFDSNLKIIYQEYLKNNKDYLEKTNYYNQYLSNLL